MKFEGLRIKIEITTLKYIFDLFSKFNSKDIVFK
jgi:hypothetical protein